MTSGVVMALSTLICGRIGVIPPVDIGSTFIWKADISIVCEQPAAPVRRMAPVPKRKWRRLRSSRDFDMQLTLKQGMKRRLKNSRNATAILKIGRASCRERE